MVVFGARLVPWLLGVVARLHDREIFTLAAVAVALGIAWLSYAVFGLSLALGAFLAGAVVSESDTSHQVAADAMPLREVFSVLFFVSVGMLVDPAFLAGHIPAIIAIVAVVVVAKALTAFLIVALLGHPPRVGLTVAAGLAQIGEFSFILATLGLSLGLLPNDGLQLVVSAALVSITLNPFLFRGVDPATRWIADHPRLGRLRGGRAPELSVLPRGATAPQNHAVIVGSGRVGMLIAGALSRRNFRFLIISLERREVESVRRQGAQALFGDATNPELLELAGIEHARVLVVAIPDAHAAQLIVERARALNSRLSLVVRTHSERQLGDLARLGPPIQPVHGEVELAVQMTRYTLRRFGVSTMEAEAVAEGLRGRGGRPWPLAGG
jgi:CPA2 family monovalent cation:H+ antiporter-2